MLFSSKSTLPNVIKVKITNPKNNNMVFELGHIDVL